MKQWLQDFPGTAAGHVTALFLILLTGLIVDVRLALGLPLPPGYESWFVLLATLAGVATAGMVGKRLSDVAYKQAGTSPVTVGGPSTVTVEATPAPAPASPSPEDKDK